MAIKENTITKEQILTKRKKHKIYLRKKYKNDKVYREKHKYNVKKYKEKNKFKILSKQYNIPENEIRLVFKRANGQCEICGSKNKLVFDHCHKTIKARGILCNKCNLLLGRLGDSVEELKKFVNYLIDR